MSRAQPETIIPQQIRPACYRALLREAGSRAIVADDELQRCFRDVHSVASRMKCQGGIDETWGGEV